MEQTGHWKGEKTIALEELIGMLEKKFNSIDYEQARIDALSFIENSTELNLWSSQFFTEITRERLKTV